MADTTVLIERIRNDDGCAFDTLFDAPYPELRRIAHLRLRHGYPDPDPELGTTARVDECLLKLHDSSRLDASDRAHFRVSRPRQCARSLWKSHLPERPSDRAPRRRRYIGNFADVEITAALDLTTRTVRRDGKKARLLLAEALR